MHYAGNHRRQILQLVVLLLMVGSNLNLNLLMAAQSKQPDQEKQDQSKAKTEKKKEDTKPAASTPPASAPTPLFEGKSGLKSSRQGKETATAGFNGVNPNGEIQKTVLAASPTAEDQAHVNAMSALSANPAELTAFAKEGSLNTPK